MKFFTYLLPVLLAPALMAFGDAHYFAIKEGNKLYAEGDYDGALELYERARDAKDSDVSNYNLGSAYFQKGEYEKAAEFFSKTRKTKDAELAEKSLSNMAVTKLKAGYEKLKNGGDKSSALDDFKEAAGAYKKILLDNSSNAVAKENMELANKKIEELEKEMPHKNKDDKKQDKEGDEEEKESGDNDDKKDANDGQKSENENEQKSEENGSEGNQEEMSPEDVKRILDALERDEKQVMKNLRLKKTRQREVEKDW